MLVCNKLMVKKMFRQRVGEGSQILIEIIGITPTRIKYLKVLIKKIKYSQFSKTNWDPITDCKHIIVYSIKIEQLSKLLQLARHALSTNRHRGNFVLPMLVHYL